ADPARLNFGESSLGTSTPVGIYPAGAGSGGVLDMAWTAWGEAGPGATLQSTAVRHSASGSSQMIASSFLVFG
ncbi:MAG: hypothetical protein ACRD2A_13115, partial [Vicinamibacterales bacterium]